MIERKVIIKNPTGLHARPASLLVKEANKFKSEIMINKNGKDVNAKSILSVLSLGVSNGDEIIIKANGEDEKEAMDAIINLIETFVE
ncbi:MULTISPECIES: HPr family phosphocarrier protein [unclassified Caloramator]|jgi:phosphocarrier protein HPr|uniref:HPr family phosphocarrier protein n=1 Tax=unclassified Caloramator TaxID=2629145 RepID=UPI00237D45B0|nr:MULTISPECIES: HPr family phosphocarrier protein [unclassified Caloramator]MDO6355479.1 HPr family phosphocarrier protein [Caloramator sp. CAR-1]WDU83285.1 HPr family phosphocarrier protein [Caloramator sp. Dgby_cultured_2]